MNIKYILVEIDTVICQACQDYLSLVVKDGWQEKLYSILNNAIANHEHPEKYRKTFNKMDDMEDLSAFNTTDMDITVIVSVIAYRDDFVFTHQKVKNSLKTVSEDRNDSSHSTKNETPEELHERGLVSLRDLERFIQTVNDYQATIEYKELKIYKKKYKEKINDLRKALNDEYANYLLNKELGEEDKEISKNEEKTETNERYPVLTVGGVSGNRKVRLGRIHKKSEAAKADFRDAYCSEPNKITEEKKTRLGRIHKKTDSNNT